MHGLKWPRAGQTLKIKKEETEIFLEEEIPGSGQGSNFVYIE